MQMTLNRSATKSVGNWIIHLFAIENAQKEKTFSFQNQTFPPSASILSIHQMCWIFAFFSFMYITLPQIFVCLNLQSVNSHRLVWEFRSKKRKISENFSVQFVVFAIWSAVTDMQQWSTAKCDYFLLFCWTITAF